MTADRPTHRTAGYGGDVGLQRMDDEVEHGARMKREVESEVGFQIKCEVQAGAGSGAVEPKRMVHYWAASGVGLKLECKDGAKVESEAVELKWMVCRAASEVGLELKCKVPDGAEAEGEKVALKWKGRCWATIEAGLELKCKVQDGAEAEGERVEIKWKVRCWATIEAGLELKCKVQDGAESDVGGVNHEIDQKVESNVEIKCKVQDDDGVENDVFVKQGVAMNREMEIDSEHGLDGELDGLYGEVEMDYQNRKEGEVEIVDYSEEANSENINLEVAMEVEKGMDCEKEMEGEEPEEEMDDEMDDEMDGEAEGKGCEKTSVKHLGWRQWKARRYTYSGSMIN